ncbi:MAG: histidine kinase, partial [Ketobacteraceae bacterium]|nr:histidine kinase [Ketobacteraceae bacterium]
LVGIAVTALLSMFASMMVAETLEGDAQAINLSGSMRMQSYRMANAALLPSQHQNLDNHIAEFQEKIDSPLLTHATQINGNAELEKRLADLHEQWRFLKPLLRADTEGQAGLMEQIDDFVHHIDQFVFALEHSSESKIRLLRALQGITVFIVILVSFFVLYNINQNMAIPLRDLVAQAEQIRQGNFRVVSHYNGADELGLLATSFNEMSAELEALYWDLEQRVKEKTRQLQQSNDSLRILYNASRRLYGAPSDIIGESRSFLSELTELLGLGNLSLCLSTSETGSAYQILTSNGKDKPEFCQAPNCNDCRLSPNKAEFIDSLQEVVSFPIGSHEHYSGELTLEIPAGKQLEEWQRNLLNAFADIIYTTLSLNNLAEQESRLALMEERAVIARELHDSLAQSLSYQKLQAAKLKRLVEKDAEKDQLYSTIRQIQDGLNASYRQLRELLATFRIKIDAPGLEPALIGTVAEYQERCDIQINLDYQLHDCPLSPNEEIHCLQIVREAVSNVVKHSQASQADITLVRTADGNVNIRIADNGIGIPDLPHKTNHYGLSILSERTESLKGGLRIERRPEGGTLVSLTFRPGFMNPSSSINSSQAS